MEIKSNSMVWCVYVSLTMFVSCIYLFGCLSVCVRPISASKFFFKQKSVLVERIDLLSTVSWDLLLLLNYWWERRHNISQSCHRWYFSIFYWINRAKKTFTHNVFFLFDVFLPWLILMPVILILVKLIKALTTLPLSEPCFPVGYHPSNNIWSEE